MKTSRLALYAVRRRDDPAGAGALGTAEPGRRSQGRRSAASLAGQLLVALPELEDPRFTRTVIYMVKHDSRGAIGLIVNRPLGDIPIAVLLKQAGLPATGAKGSVRLHVGGPVEADARLRPALGRLQGPRHVRGRRRHRRHLRAGDSPGHRRGQGSAPRALHVGFAGWAPGQLEAEMQAGYWVIVPSDDAILFDDAYETKWDRAMAKRRINL